MESLCYTPETINNATSEINCFNLKINNIIKTK